VLLAPWLSEAFTQAQLLVLQMATGLKYHKEQLCYRSSCLTALTTEMSFDAKVSWKCQLEMETDSRQQQEAGKDIIAH
jgi:hypothetical protein